MLIYVESRLFQVTQIFMSLYKMLLYSFHFYEHITHILRAVFALFVFSYQAKLPKRDYPFLLHHMFMRLISIVEFIQLSQII